MRTKNTLLAVGLAVGAAALVPANTAWGLAHNDWNGGTTGNWNVAANWSLHVPGLGSASYDYVYINPSSSGGDTVTVNTSNSGAGYTIINSVGLNAAGDRPIIGPATLDVATGGYLQGGSFSVSNVVNDTLNVAGGQIGNTAATNTSLNLGGYTGTGSAMLNVSSGGTLNVNALTLAPGSVGSLNGSTNGTGGAVNIGIHGINLGGTNSSAGTTAGFTQNGGTFTSPDEFNIIGDANPGIYTMNSGIFSAGPTQIGNGAAGTLTIGGNAATPASATLGSLNLYNGKVTVGSGGSLAVTGGTTVGGGSASATLQIVGDAGSFSTTISAGHSPLVVSTNGTLDFQIGTDGHVSTLNAIYSAPGPQDDTRGTLLLGGTLQIDMPIGFTPAYGTTYTLISTNNVIGTGTTAIDDTGAAVYDGSTIYYPAFTPMQLAAADQGLWSVGLLNTGSATELQAQYIGPVPEPATLGLMAMAGAGILLLPRKRRAVEAT